MHILGAELFILLDFFMALILKNPVVAGWALHSIDEVMGLTNSYFTVGEGEGEGEGEGGK
jgi:hypothetical protein